MGHEKGTMLAFRTEVMGVVVSSQQLAMATLNGLSGQYGIIA